MAITYKDDWIDRIEARGEARGEAKGSAQMLLGILATRGFTVPGPIRRRILASTDLGQLQAWANSAVTGASLDEIFAA